jgi:hypothetical protein
MGTTAEKLAKLAATKADLKAAIIEKGQTVGDVFSDYPDAVRAIETGSKVPLEAVTQLKAVAGNAKVSLTWTDPVDKTATPGGEVVAAWAHTKIIRKVGSAPAGPNDGVLVVESGVRNQYQSTPYVDTEVSNDVTYFYAAYAYTETGVVSEGANTEGVTPKDANIYGVEWNGTETTKWTRTDASAAFADPEPAVNNGAGSSPFDNLMPWKGMVKSEDPEAGTLVAIPKFWYKLTQTANNGIKIQIADNEVEGFSVSPAHMDRGDSTGERDVVYVGRYHCEGSTFKSGKTYSPKHTINRSSARTSIHNLGNDIWQFDFAMRFTIWLLYLVEFADWNSQDVIGYGCSPNGSLFGSGSTDDMQYHTGTTKSTRTTYGCCQYRNIEGLWDNIYDWLDGCYYDDNGLNIVLNPNQFSDDSNGVNAGTPVSNNFASKFKVSDTGKFSLFFPIESNGSDSTYSCDRWYAYGKINPCLYCGAAFSKNKFFGLFGMSSFSESTAEAYIGCRLMKLP